jgi:Domain of unknown function (DUF5134)
MPMATPVPSWLYYLFGVLMLTVAAYCLTLLVLGALTHRPAGRDVEISHLFMGVAMAGMFVGAWSFGRRAVWEIVFAVVMIWFLVACIQSVQRYGLHLPHALVHAAMNFAMLLMYWFPMGASSPSGAMSMTASAAGGRLDPGLALVLAFLLCTSAVFTLASPVKGRTHFGSHAPVYALTGPTGPTGPTGTGPTGTGPSGPGPTGSTGPLPDGGPSREASSLVVGIEERVATPSLVDVSHVVMCVAMAFMLILLA